MHLTAHSTLTLNLKSHAVFTHIESLGTPNEILYLSIMRVNSIKNRQEIVLQSRNLREAKQENSK